MNPSAFPKKVKIVEVGPRDGLQNESLTIPTATKIEFINQLSQTGLKVIEATSFVSPKRIPQLADNTEVLAGITREPDVSYPVLVPNLQGFNQAEQAGAKHIAVFTTVSETFSQKNTHCSIEESLNRISEIMTLAKSKSMPVRGYISCVLGCPYEGEIAFDVTAKIAKKLYKLGCNEISLGDTIGVGTPLKAQTLLKTILTQTDIPIQKLALHFHDTYGQALANILACLELGVSVFDSAVAGIGGCPYAKGATGNVATEDLIYMLNGMNIETGVDLNAILKVSKFVSEFTHRSPRSKVAIAKLSV